jgi:2-succinyl-5-enolpyruvyl-6-hydroxy-3-cyclohexene-1-carboxylate synthase
VQQEERLGHACIMPAAPDTHLLLRAFVDELVRCGVREACTSPGSRSSPIVFALACEPRLRCFSHVDERCAGFFALGAAKASIRPVAITCTSGTAAANLAPAVIEAYEARVPLVVLTADRPPELREIGAGQAIDQIKLYSAAKWFFEVGTHAATPERARWMRMLACRAVWTALEGRPGPVHLNFALREPLVPPAELGPDPEPGRAGGRPWLLRSTPGEDAVAAGRALAVVARDAHRPVVVAGRAEPGLEAIAPACERLGWPLLADPLSGARRGGAAIAHYDALLRDGAFAGARRPDLVVRCGDLPTSKPLRAWLAGLGGDVTQLGFDPQAAWQDPDATLHAVLAASPAPALAAVAERAPVADPAWLDGWRRADAAAAAAIDATLGDELSEPLVARELGALLPADATLFVASSMPVRDVECFIAARDAAPRVLCNRGANGIDGTVSSAFGAAAVSSGPVALLIGDVALAHDIGGLLAARRLDLALTIVVLHNDGGGIFEFLPLAGAERRVFEEHVATPHGLAFEHAAALYGCAYARVHDRRALRAQLRAALAGHGTSIVEVRTDRAENLALHRELSAAVAARLSGAA